MATENGNTKLHVVPNLKPVAEPTDIELASFAKAEFNIEISGDELSKPVAASTRRMLREAFLKKVEEAELALAKEREAAEQAALVEKLKALNSAIHSKLHPPKGPVERLTKEQIASMVREHHEDEKLVEELLMEQMREKYGKKMPDFIFVLKADQVFKGAKVNARGELTEVRFDKPSNLVMAYRGYCFAEMNKAKEIVAATNDPVDQAALALHVEKISTHINGVSEIAKTVFFVDFDKNGGRDHAAPESVFLFVRRLAAKNEAMKKFFALPLIGEERAQRELQQMKEREAAETLHRERREAEQKLRTELKSALESAGCGSDALPKIVERLLKKFEGSAQERLKKAALGQAVLAKTASDDSQRQTAQAAAVMYARAAGIDALELEAMADEQIGENHSPTGKKTPEVERKLTASEREAAAEAKRKARKAKKGGEKPKGKKK